MLWWRRLYRKLVFIFCFSYESSFRLAEYLNARRSRLDNACSSRTDATQKIEESEEKYEYVEEEEDMNLEKEDKVVTGASQASTEPKEVGFNMKLNFP